jgi:hypothetical protein
MALTGEFRGPWPAAVNIDLQFRFGNLETRRAAVHHATERRAVTLPKTGDRENPPESVARHA